ncbi:MAG: hypothetical protein K8S97_10350, partial [Anaerolineae bacterium]|nr:hypothetical protein [Anaerolineae bacterium]
MADQPDNTPLTPESDPTPDPTPSAEQPAAQPPQEDQPASSSSGWHEPPVPEGSSKPVVVEAWYKPDDAVEDKAAEQADAATEPVATKPGESTTPVEAATAEALPGDIPGRAGAWFTPLDAQLDALFEGADETIAEVHQPAQPPPQPARVDDATQPQAVGDTKPQPAQAAAEAESAPADSVPAVVADTGDDESETRVIGAVSIESAAEAAVSAASDAPEPEIA